MSVDNRDSVKMSVGLQAFHLASSIVDNPTEFDTLIARMRNLPLKNESDLQMCVSQIFELALRTQTVEGIERIAKICYSMKDVDKSSNKDQKVTFNELLIKRCKRELEVKKGNIDLFDMNKLSSKMLLSQTKNEEQEVMNKFAKN